MNYRYQDCQYRIPKPFFSWNAKEITMACLNQNPNHGSDKQQTQDILNPEEIAYLGRKLPIVLDNKRQLGKAKYEKQVREDSTHFEKKTIFFHNKSPIDVCVSHRINPQNHCFHFCILKITTSPRELGKAVITFLGIRNEYTKSTDLMIFCFSRIRRIVFAFRSILFRRHLQISIFPSILEQLYLGLQYQC